MLVIGIDPGLDGALAFLSDDDRGVWAEVMPTLKLGKRRSLDLSGLLRLLDFLDVDLCVMEEVSAAPVRGRTQGTASMFSFGRGFGRLEGVLAALAVPLQLVRPQTWKAEVLAGTARDKAAAVAFCQRRFPSCSLLPTPRCKAPSDGIADALCLAELGRRILMGEARRGGAGALAVGEGPELQGKD